MFFINTLRPRQNGRHFADDIFKCIFLNENVWIPIQISLKFVPQGPINNIPALVQIMGWRRPGNKPLSGPMMVRLPTHIYITRPQWINRERRTLNWNTFDTDIYPKNQCLSKLTSLSINMPRVFYSVHPVSANTRSTGHTYGFDS